MHPLDFETFIKFSTISGALTVVGMLLNMLRLYSEIQQKKTSIESKRKMNVQFPTKKRIFPSCIENDLKSTSKKKWYKMLVFAVLFIIVSNLFYAFFRNISINVGVWYNIFIAILTYVAAFGPIFFLIANIVLFGNLYLRLTEYDSHPDLYNYNCKE